MYSTSTFCPLTFTWSTAAVTLLALKVYLVVALVFASSGGWGLSHAIGLQPRPSVDARQNTHERRFADVHLSRTAPCPVARALGLTTRYLAGCRDT